MDLYLAGNNFLTVGDSIMEQPVMIMPTAHYKADGNDRDGTNRIATWFDLSGNGNHVHQPTQSLKPIFNPANPLFNNRPSIDFNGSVFFDGGTNILNPGNDSMTVFVVGRHTTPTGTYISKSMPPQVPNGWFMLYDASRILYYADNHTIVNIARAPGTPEIIVLDRNRVLNRLSGRANRAELGNIAFSPVNMVSGHNLLIGAYNNAVGGLPPTGGYFLNGSICEIRVYINPIPLTLLQITTIENELRAFYGTP